MVAIPGPRNNTDLMRLTGGFLAGFSAVMMPLVLFVLPGSCSIVAVFEVFLLFILFIGGLVLLLVGQVMAWRKNKSGDRQ
jgi:hypothetical protein